ncbi:hypothetical protein J0H58_35535 [bacterium]|nr:hypothetical protein [bacterium]
MRLCLQVLVRRPRSKPVAVSDGQPALGSNLKLLDKALAKAGLRPLSDFLPADPAGGDWFPATDGLAAVTAAAEYLEATPLALPWSDIAVRELSSVGSELAPAAAEGYRFRFALAR